MTLKQKLSTAKAKAQAANKRIDPKVDSWVLSVAKRLADSPYTGPIILATVLLGGIVAILALL